MGPYYFGLTNGERVLGGNEPTELAGLSEVQDEALRFARAVLKHRHTIGIDDISPWAVRVTNEIGRVLAVVPLSRVKSQAKASEGQSQSPINAALGARAADRG